MRLDDRHGEQRAVEFVGVGAVFLPQKHGRREIGERTLEVALVEVHLAAVLPGVGGEPGPLVHLGVEDAVGQLARGLIKLALKLQNLGSTDATGHGLLPVAGEARLTQRLIRDLPGFVESTDQAQQGDLLIEGGEAAQVAELGESLASGQKVDFLAQSDGIVTDDETQGVFL